MRVGESLDGMTCKSTDVSRLEWIDIRDEFTFALWKRQLLAEQTYNTEPANHLDDIGISMFEPSMARDTLGFRT
jgi:hypothetical protein